MQYIWRGGGRRRESNTAAGRTGHHITQLGLRGYRQHTFSSQLIQKAHMHAVSYSPSMMWRFAKMHNTSAGKRNGPFHGSKKRCKRHLVLSAQGAVHGAVCARASVSLGGSWTLQAIGSAKEFALPRFVCTGTGPVHLSTVNCIKLCNEIMHWRCGPPNGFAKGQIAGEEDS